MSFFKLKYGSIEFIKCMAYNSRFVFLMDFVLFLFLKTTKEKTEKYLKDRNA